MRRTSYLFLVLTLLAGCSSESTDDDADEGALSAREREEEEQMARSDRLYAAKRNLYTLIYDAYAKVAPGDIKEQRADYRPLGDVSPSCVSGAPPGTRLYWWTVSGRNRDAATQALETALKDLERQNLILVADYGTPEKVVTFTTPGNMYESSCDNVKYGGTPPLVCKNARGIKGVGGITDVPSKDQCGL